MTQQIKVIFLLFLSSIYLFGASKDTIQIKVNNDRWKLIGVPGFHDESPSTTTTSGTSWASLTAHNASDSYDSDNNTSWYNVSSGNLAYASEINGSIGIYILKDGTFPDGTKVNDPSDTVYVKGGYKEFRQTASKSSMYVKYDSNSNNILKITYQIDMEGLPIYIKFDNVDDYDYYSIKLDSSKTNENPYILKGNESGGSETNTTISNTLVKKIVDTFDENLSDNNKSSFLGDDFNLSSGGSIENDFNVTIFSYDSGDWKSYDSRNGNSGNDFDEFSTAKGYWVKAQSPKSDPMGFIFAKSDITDNTWSIYYNNLQNGWNLLSFNSETIRYSSTGVFVEFNAIQNSGLKITDAYNNNEFELIAGACDSEKNASAYINFQVELNNQLGHSNYRLRAYPAQRDDNTSGIVIISANRFDVNQTNGIETLAGNSLKYDQINSYYYPDYNEYQLAIQPNSSIFNIDAPIKVTLQNSSNTGNGDINLSNRDLYDFAVEFQKALSSIGKSYSKTYMIDTNWDDNNETLLLCTDVKFGIKESSYYKVFQQVDSGAKAYIEGKVVGSSAKRFDIDPSISTTVSNINNHYNDTLVKAFVSNPTQNTILLISEQADLDIKEGANKNCFNDVAITSIIDSNDTKKGAIKEIYQPNDLINLTVYYDNNSTYDVSRNIGKGETSLSYILPNLSYQTVWTKEFEPNSGAIQKLAQLSGKKVIKMYTAEILDNGIKWIYLDATKNPRSWFDDYDTQTLLWTEAKRGYWVYLEDYTPPTIAQSLNLSSNPKVTTHFDNNISSTTGISTTKNYTRKDYTISTSSSNGNMEMEYTYASVGGIQHTLIANGATMQLRIDSYQIGLEQSSSNSAISLNTYDGLGGKKEDSNFTTLDIAQPTTPDISIDQNTWQLTINNDDFAYWELYESYISDLNPSNTLIEQNSSDIKTIELSNLSIVDSWVTSNPYIDLLLVTKGTNGFYSNIRAIKYAPVHENSHVLKAPSDGSYDKYPKDYTLSTPTTLTSDSGVSIKSLIGSPIYISYQPVRNSSDSNYLSFDNEMPYLMYLKADNIDLAVIKFIPSYLGKGFYIYDENNKKLYYGVFNIGYEYKGSGAFDLTSNAMNNYNLTDQSIIK